MKTESTPDQDVFQSILEAQHLLSPHEKKFLAALRWDGSWLATWAEEDGSYDASDRQAAMLYSLRDQVEARTAGDGT